MHTVIFLPGLKDRRDRIEPCFSHWKRHGFTPLLHLFGWKKLNEPIEKKYIRLYQVIDAKLKKGNVSICGNSASGHVAVSALIERPQLSMAVNNCGALRQPTAFDLRILLFYIRRDRKIAQASFDRFLQMKIPEELKKKIITVHARYFDQMTPSNLTTLPGAYNISVPCFEHVSAMKSALTTYSGEIMKMMKP